LHALILHQSCEDRNFFRQDRKLNNAESVLDLTDEDIERARTWTEEGSHAMFSTELEEELH
jgi:hypothetical protein